MFIKELIVLRAIRDANVPKFLQDDLKLFDGIVSDLFPKIKEEPVDYGCMEESIRARAKEKGLEDVDGESDGEEGRRGEREVGREGRGEGGGRRRRGGGGGGGRGGGRGSGKRGGRREGGREGEGEGGGREGGSGEDWDWRKEGLPPSLLSSLRGGERFVSSSFPPSPSLLLSLFSSPPNHVLK